MRSVLAGHGGWDPSLTPDFHGVEADPPPALIPPSEVLFREICEKVSLATRILGPVAEVVHQGRLDAPTGASLVAWKHQVDKRYGHLEIVRSPHLSIRSPYDAREDTLEITGSAGVAWASHGMGRMRNEPAVRFYLQEDLLCYERIEEDYLYGITAFARDFLGQTEKRLIDHPSLGRVVDAVAVAEIVHKADADGRRRPAGSRS